jgi:hypothetical protein
LERTIAARLEAQVGDGAHFLPIFEFNQLRCFGKFELPAFASNLRQWAERADRGQIGVQARRLAARACVRAGGLRQRTIHHFARCAGKIPAKENATGYGRRPGVPALAFA